MANVAENKASASVQKNAPAPAEQTKQPEAPATQEGSEQKEGSKPPTGFIKELEKVLATSKSRATGGSRIRPDVGYTLVEEGLAKLKKESIPDQQKAILRLMNQALTVEKPVISESELHDMILAAHKSQEFKTKQDPWHVFRYYRASMKKTGVLKEVPVEVAPEAAKAA